MDYPNDFSVPAFPAGKTIALSRSFSTWILIIFFLIISACGGVLLLRSLQTNYPFLISIDPFTDEWTTVAFPKQKQEKMNQYEIIQEKLVNDYVIDWFTISDIKEINESRWQECAIEECNEPTQFNPSNTNCALSCKSSSAVFQEFLNKVLPQYHAMIDQASETWRVVGKQIIPIVVSENSGKWQVHITIQSKVMGTFYVLAFIDVERKTDSYPATFGYYINQFNSYRIDQL